MRVTSTCAKGARSCIKHAQAEKTRQSKATRAQPALAPQGLLAPDIGEKALRQPSRLQGDMQQGDMRLAPNPQARLVLLALNSMRHTQLQVQSTM